MCPPDHAVATANRHRVSALRVPRVASLGEDKHPPDQPRPSSPSAAGVSIGALPPSGSRLESPPPDCCGRERLLDEAVDTLNMPAIRTTQAGHAGSGTPCVPLLPESVGDSTRSGTRTSFSTGALNVWLLAVARGAWYQGLVGGGRPSCG
jgi:hypothetical protein